MKTIAFAFLVMLLQYHKFEAEGAPKIMNFDFYVPQRSPQRTKNNDFSQFLVVETSQKVDMKCRDGETQSHWTAKKSQGKVIAPFIAQQSSAGEYECPVRRYHLIVTEPMQFFVTSSADIEDSIKLYCGMNVYTDQKNLLLSMEILDYENRAIGKLSLFTQEETSKVHLDVDTKKTQKEILFASPQTNSFSCVLKISDTHQVQPISETRKSLAVKLYSPLKNVRPNVTRMSIGQSVQCLSDSVPPAHRYEWKFYDGHKENKFQKEFYISSGHILKIFEQGNHNFICTAFNLMGGKEYSLSWVGSLQVVGERKVEARSIGKWVIGGSVVTVVMLVAVVSYARR